ncbi:MAG: hypothetical protein ABS49_07340 [Erythrobacter sp. SCN 62-14]|nr:MAG: hypothetical protein ABS49_07340 [Erythrobacter sp. SCN 62-14]
MDATTTSTASGTPMPTEWRDFFTLTKPRVMTLVIFTAICGVLAAPGSIHPVLGFTAILAISMGAGGSAVLNMWWEADIDAGMKRTMNRPLPGGRMRREDARDFGIFLSAVSVALMGVAIGGTGWIYGMTAVTLSALFILLAWPVGQRMRSEDDKMLPEKKLFKFSIYYLFALFAALVLDRVAAYQGWIA